MADGWDITPQARATDNRLDHAMRLFESRPDFVAVQVRMKERMHVAESKKSSESEVFRTDARMEYVLTLFDIRAQAFLELVVDAETQNAFVNLLRSFELVAWQESFHTRPTATA